jgi:hypothetical protein
VPVILGAGIPLFGQHVTTAQLTLHQTFVDDGIVVLHYRRRETHDDHTA